MLEQKKKFIEGPSLLTFSFLKRHNIFCGFTSRAGGYSERPYNFLNLAYHVGDKWNTVRKNRQLILKNILDLRSEYIYSAQQVHGNNIIFIGKDTGHKDGAIPEEADCLMTNLTNTPIMVMGADCNLILIADIGKRAVCAVHAGWRGTFNKILEDSLAVFCNRFDSKKKEVYVFLGPSIRGCCYNIDGALAGKFIKRFGEGKYLIDRERGPFLDLAELNLIQLKSFGIPENNIYDSGICTGCDRQYYSYRRESHTGRQAAIAMVL